MKNLAVLSVILLFSSACDRDPTFVTTKERPPAITFAYVKAEGSIVIKEEHFAGPVSLVCPSGSASGVSTGYTWSTRYSIMARLELSTLNGTENCRIDVGQPVILSRPIELPVALRPAAVEPKRFDITVPPDSIPPARMDGPIVALAAGGGHSCAVAASGSMYCWGANDKAQLGTGFHVSSLYAVKVATTERAIAAAAGGVPTFIVSNETYTTSESTSCLLNAAGLPFCWGEPVGGAVDHASTKELATPRPVAGVPSLLALKAGPRVTCGLSTARTLYCWGFFFSSYQYRANALPWTGVIDFAVGWRHACAILDDGTTRCWASNPTIWGELGDSTATTRYRKIAAGKSFTCALDENGYAHCWGRNDTGQLGRGTVDPVCRDYYGNNEMPCPGTDASPKRVQGDIRFKEIDAGESHVCAIAIDDVMYCWGAAGGGQLGDGTLWQDMRVSPRQVAAPLGVADPIRFKLLATGERHTCALALNENVYCWGFGALGQLGTNARESRSVATPVWQP